MKRILCILCLVLPLFALSVSAEGALDVGWDTEMKDTADGFLSRLEELLPPEISLPVGEGDALTEAVGVEGLLSVLTEALAAQREELISFFLTLLGVVLLCSLVSALGEGTADSTPISLLSAVLSLSLLEPLLRAVEGVTEQLGEATEFFATLLPLLTAVTAATGAEATAATQTLTLSLTVELLQGALSELLLPLGGMLFALGLVGMLSDGGGAQALAEQLRRIFTWGLGLLCTLTAAAVTLQTVLSAATDTLALRTARYTLSGMLPAVGGTVAGALSTLLGGLSYVKSTVGVGAIAALLALLVPPLLRLLIYRAALGLAGGLMRMLSGGRAVGVPDTLRSALDVYIALLSVSGVLMILEVVLFIRCGVSLV